MSASEELPADLKAFEAELSALAPIGARIDRDRLMYTLGVQAALARSSVEPAGGDALTTLWWRRPLVWQVAALVLACTSLGLRARLATVPRTIERSVYVRPDATGSVAPAVVSSDAPAGRTAKPRQAVPVHTRLAADELWLAAMAAPGYRWKPELRARVPRPTSDPSTPLVVIPARPTAEGEGRASSSAALNVAHPLRLHDQRLLSELLGGDR
ncbi:MAG: hypothetical protein AB7U73_04555 [Pirellulales bacterium]